MIQVLDQNDREIYKYRLLQGENRFGSDPKQCKHLIRNVQGFLFSVALLKNDVYLTHFSSSDQVFKEATLQQDQKVEIPKNFIIEMVPIRNYYFQNIKFKLLNLVDNAYLNKQCIFQTTQVLEDFGGTMALDDILDCPQQIITKISATQQVSTTQILSSQDQDLSQSLKFDENDSSALSSLQELIQQYPRINQMIKSNSSTIDTSTQTENMELEPQQQKSRTLFSELFKFKKLTPQIQQTSQLSNPINNHQYQSTQIDQTILDSQIQNVNSDDIQNSQFLKKKAEQGGTIIDEDLEKAFSSEQNNRSIKQEESTFKRLNSTKSDNVQITCSRLENNSKIELNDLFGSLPELPNQQIQQQPKSIKKFNMTKSNILNNRFEDAFQDMYKSQDQKEQTPIKLRSQIQKLTSIIGKEGKKQSKSDLKKVALLKKITDEISDETSGEPVQQKYNIRHANSMELPANKLIQQNNSINNKQKENQRPFLKKNKIIRLIAFSGFQQHEIPKSNDLKLLGLEIVSNQLEKFDLLVLNNPPKRTFKFLSALMLGAEIVTLDWLTTSLKEGKVIQHFQNYIPNSEEFLNSFGFSIQQILQSRDSYFETNENLVQIFDGKYFVKVDVTPSKAEIEYLIKLGGGQIQQKPDKNAIIISDIKIGNSMPSDYILDGCMFQQ
ncbi:unnamed protein product (macronuclear) [Paramecium tetraurelia]|uniref:BRCT domain-containing protein n=1 Tax=Paramecium tetraurelia TaxID=5888 RepID=A0EDB7_PARTE|nr:uncharacterized protein GSPATT00004153001 [Paramecium tetraurelia]CAK93284.1 unnamed protein product [Paramecium tetraurelia]|eukprot:XP_001460681.1 hypothetical protein (macronuclear) [Paramecium tetraurelia strain d4-2]